MNGIECSDGVCHHELQNNTADSRCQPPVPQFNSESVTVTARNIVRRSNPARPRSVWEFRNIPTHIVWLVYGYPWFQKKGSLTCTINSTGCPNINLGVSVDTSNPASVLVECTFEPGYTCTIVYGTDPTYTNLVYSDASTTLGQVTTIALSQDLQRETNYFICLLRAILSVWGCGGDLEQVYYCNMLLQTCWWVYSKQPSFQYLLRKNINNYQ